MIQLRFAALTLLIGVLASRAASAQTREGRAWAFTASMYTYFMPDAPSYVQPAATANRGALHLEARYNYEESNAASAWIGYNLRTGDELTLDFTVMVGGVFGSTTGIAPGYEGTLSWRKLELYSEGEYLFDLEDSAENYFYNWSQVSLAPTDWIFFGIVTQRTRVYETDRELNRGPFLGFSYKDLSLTTFVINPDDASPTVIIGLDVGF